MPNRNEDTLGTRREPNGREGLQYPLEPAHIKCMTALAILAMRAATAADVAFVKHHDQAHVGQELPQAADAEAAFR